MSSAIDIAKGIGYLTVREVEAIQEIARRLPANPMCVNIGSGAGTSVIALMEARTDAIVIDIDLSPDAGLSQMREAGLADSPLWIRRVGDSKAIEHEGSPLDYLFVDGDHTEEGIRGDLATWLPRVNHGGYILLHDFWPYPDDHELAGVDFWPEVRRVGDEVMARYAVVMDSDRIRVYQA